MFAIRRLLVSCTSLALLGGLFALGSARAENWPQWRGPQNNGISGEKNLPKVWSEDQNVAWRTPLPGPAGASPVVWGDRVFLTSVDGAKLVLICLGTDGKEQWVRQIGTGEKNVRGDEGNLASPSPSTDGQHVWSFFGSGDLACHTVDGKEVWKTDLQKRYGRFNIAFGMTSTPVLHGDRLYLQLIHGEGNAATREAIVICLAKATGEEIWKQDRSSDAIQENEHSYASPVMYDDGKQAIFVTHGADYTIGHDPSTGAELFRVTGLNPRNHATRKYDPTLRFVASPSFAPGILVIPTAKGGPVVAVRPDIKGTIALESPGVLWTRPKTPDVPSPVVAGDQVYLCMADGTLHAVDRTTGQELYAKRTNPIRHRSSPVYADGHIYTTGRDGKVTVVKAGPEFEIVAQNEIGEDVSSSLAISNGTLYLRSFEALWAIRQK